MARAVQVVLPERPTDLDRLVLELACFLFSKLPGIIVRVERVEGWDGSNVRIVVRDPSFADAVIDAIVEFERKRGILGTFLPEIINEEEYHALARHAESPQIPDSVFRELTEHLKRRLGDAIVRVERVDGWDGSNVRIVVRDLRVADAVIDAIIEFEKERGILGLIAPEVRGVDEA